MRNSAIVIPALNPSENLIEYIQDLLSKGASMIIVVNDGSEPGKDRIFDQIREMDHCHVLTHDINRGKGRALKTAFEYFQKAGISLSGVITADSDGQHSADDVQKIAEVLEIGRRSIILGVRDLNAEHVPFRSTIGNRLTTYLFQCLYGYRLDDTQTGLRGIPVSELSDIVRLKGERYEYEINMLIHARRAGIPFVEIPIETIYFNNNEGSHYKSIGDSLKIFRRMLRGFFDYSMEKSRKQSESGI